MTVNPFAELFSDLAAQSRSRQSWNDRLAFWERPASDSEDTQIERAADMVRAALASSTWLHYEGVVIEPQGSYYNNTNVRLDADMDLRAVHPMLSVEYSSDIIDPRTTELALGYTDAGHTFTEVARRMRGAITATLRSEFGANNVEPGPKATRVRALPGSRAPVDVVTAFGYHWIVWDQDASQFRQIPGIAIPSPSGGPPFIYNFPDLHYRNGVAKRTATRLRFKKNVRMLKVLRNEMVADNILASKQVPSFLIESLVYNVEDEHFLWDEDDRYDRLRRIVDRMAYLLSDSRWIADAREINGWKYLFRQSQPWTVEDARTFVAMASLRLGA